MEASQKMMEEKAPKPVEAQKESATFICSRDTLDGVYPPLLLAINARRQGMDAAVFFTFMGLNVIRKGWTKKIKFQPPGFLGAIPGMASMATGMMKKKIESLPPEKRKEYEDRMAAYQKGTSAETKYDVTKAGESKTISGYPCTKYIVKRNGKDYETIWATGAIGDVEVARKDMEQLMEKMSSAMKTRSTPLVWFKQIPGFPVKTERSGNTSTVSHVEKRTVSDSEFEVPAGYAREQHKGLENLGQ